METILKFLRSQTYANFWKFILTGTIVSGLLTVLSGIVFGLLKQNDPSGGWPALTYIFLIGGFYGFFAACVGFWLVYFLGRIKTVLSFKTLTYWIGTLLATAVIMTLFWSATSLNLSWYLLIFPGIPYFGSIYFFAIFSEKWIKPVL